MSVIITEIESFLSFSLNGTGPLLDVRSPGEFEQGHIPGAINLPLFSNDERTAVGICYKQQGRDAAVELGLDFVGPKMRNFVQQAKQYAPQGAVGIHCWRGGMRSSSMAWLLDTAGLQVTLLEGGYKGFRRWVRTVLAKPKTIHILGGMTGTGKTEVLEALAAQGEQVLNLEAIANHRGSSYGSLNLPPQPTTEQFENEIAVQWHQFDGQRPIWIEAESKQVGTCRVPPELFQQMDQSPIWELQRSLSERIQYLIQLYGTANPAQLLEATERIRKRLGSEKTDKIKTAITNGHLDQAIELVLGYYDKTYCYDLNRRSVQRSSLEITGLNCDQITSLLLQSYPV